MGRTAGATTVGRGWFTSGGKTEVRLCYEREDLTRKQYCERGVDIYYNRPFRFPPWNQSRSAGTCWTGTLDLSSPDATAKAKVPETARRFSFNRGRVIWGPLEGRRG